jgi:uncharacterized membrane protein
MNHGVKNGLLYGGISVIVSLVFYLFNPELMFTWWITLILGFGLALFFMIKAAREEKADNDGILTYGEAVKTTFLVVIVATVISTVYNHILMAYIDPSLVDQLAEISIKSAQASAEMFGAPEETLDEIREQFEEQDFTPTIGKTISQLVSSAVIMLIFSLIVSAFVKKNPSLD